MAYRFRLKESVQHGLRRIAVEQIDRALVPPEAGQRATWVHETRKSLKRLRALLRLVRGGLDAQTWRAENEQLRDIGRGLAPMRDRDVLGLTIARLQAEAGKGLATPLRWLGRSLAAAAEARDAETSDEVAHTAAIAQALDDLARTRLRLGAIHVDGDLADVLAGGITDARRRAHAALTAAESDTSPANLHELRKAVQAHWRHMQLVQAAWPCLTAARITAARLLSQVLGEVQDLAVLAEAATASARSAAEQRHAERIAEACAKRQADLYACAIPGAARLFATPCKAAGAEIATCWRAAASLGAAACAAPPPDAPPRKRARRTRPAA